MRGFRFFFPFGRGKGKSEREGRVQIPILDNLIEWGFFNRVNF